MREKINSFSIIDHDVNNYKYIEILLKIKIQKILKLILQ